MPRACGLVLVLELGKPIPPEVCPAATGWVVVGMLRGGFPLLRNPDTGEIQPLRGGGTTVPGWKDGDGTVIVPTLVKNGDTIHASSLTVDAIVNPSDAGEIVRDIQQAGGLRHPVGIDQNGRVIWGRSRVLGLQRLIREGSAVNPMVSIHVKGSSD